jgi:hypothetical protein
VYCPHLICGQFVEHCKLTFLQRIQPTSSLHFLKEIQAPSLVTLGKGLAVFRYEEF